MTATRLHEYVIPAALFGLTPPTAGVYFTSRSGETTFLVSKVRRVGGDTRPMFRLIGTRLRRNDLPAGIDPLPWPDQVRKRRSRAAEPVKPTEIPQIQTLADKQKAERKRIIANRRAAQDPNHQLVDPIRLINQTVEQADWRDPDDLSTTRRTARVIHGVRATDVIERLLQADSINKKQAKAARRFRRLYEMGSIGFGLGTRDLSAPPSGFASGTPPSEARLAALLAYNQAAAAIGPRLLTVVMAIVIRGETIQSYAGRTRRSRSGTAGYITACFDALIDHFERIDEEQDQRQAQGAATGT